jgi:hypothetical protein
MDRESDLGRKQYLLTWYGITDLRAALGFEESVGPVLSALKTGHYTDVVILGYTDSSKNDGEIKDDEFNAWEKWHQSSPFQREPFARQGQAVVTERVANTTRGHRIFVEWLKHQLEEAQVSVSVHFQNHALKKLNDASAIHIAASSAVRFVLDDPSEKQMTVYVSPGTPIMAYTWALIARSNPHLDMAVLASSNPNLPPEEVQIPRSLMSPPISNTNHGSQDVGRYDVVIHLLGAQSLPVFLGIRQFESAQHHVITSSEFRKAADRLIARTGTVSSAVLVDDPFKPGDTRRLIENLVEEIGPTTRVAVNVTGGTKLMFAGALSACWDLGLDPIYFEVQNHNMVFLRTGQTVPFVGISNLDDFIEAAGYVVSQPGRWPVDPDDFRNRRLSAARQVWEQRDALSSLYRDRLFLKFSDDWNRHQPRHERDNLPFDFEWGNSRAFLTANGESHLILNGQEIHAPTRGLFSFLSGHWLEDFMYALLHPLFNEGLIRDVRVGMEVGYQRYPHSDLDTFSELDCVFSDGKRLWIVECKAGAIRQDAIQKLENNVRMYGGVSAKGLFVSALPAKGVHKSRLENSTTVVAIDPRQLSTESLRHLILKQ